MTLPSGGIPGYRVLARVGAGAMAEVFRAARESDGAVHAVKLLHESAAGNRAIAAAFQCEGDLLERLDHPVFTKVHSRGEADGRDFLVEDFIEGESLRKWSAGRPLAEVLRSFAALAGGLAHLHRAGFLHRDVKPANVLVDSDGRPHLLDLGIAGPIAEGGSHEGWSRAGTPRYMSPEQILGRAAGGSADLFSLAVCLFEAVANRHPFARDSEAGTLSAILTEAPERLSRIVPVSAGLDAVVAHALSKTPEGRYRDGDELAADLHACAADPSIEAGALIAGRRLGLSRSWATLPGRAKASTAIRRWLAARRPAPLLVLRGEPGTGRTALLDWARSVAAERGIDSGSQVRFVDDGDDFASLGRETPTVVVLPESAPLPAGIRAVVVRLAPLGAGAVRDWVRRDLALDRVDSRDVAALLRASGGMPVRLAPLILRWGDLLRDSEAPTPGRLSEILESQPVGVAAVERLLDALSPSARLIAELVAFAHPGAVDYPQALEASGTALADAPARLFELRRARLGFLLEGSHLRTLEEPIAETIRSLVDPGTGSDLRRAVVELLGSDERGEVLARCAELHHELGEITAGTDVALHAVRRLRSAGRSSEVARVVELWSPRIPSPSREWAEAVTFAVEIGVASGEPRRAERLLEVASGWGADEIRSELALAAGMFRLLIGELDLARKLLLSISASARRTGEEALRLRAVTSLGIAELRSGRISRASILFRMTTHRLDLFAPEKQVRLLSNHAVLAVALGRFAEAASSLEQAHALADTHRLDRVGRELTVQFAELHLAGGSLAACDEWISRGLAGARRAADPETGAFLLQTRARADLSRGRIEAALRSLRASTRGAIRVGQIALARSNDACEAEILAHRADGPGARKALGRARRRSSGAGSIDRSGKILVEADLLLLDGKTRAARSLLTETGLATADLDESSAAYRDVLLALAGGVPPGDPERLLANVRRHYIAFREKEFRRRIAALPVDSAAS